ncbi:GntR family transcriptional regulator [[Clostridium] polysaccharolyticum]|uniref:DNA-binding transcriptional regulator YhcF, GntR family n=1 Tax=[Clostridium] polysaccharolyticum TaxID=29364 RepID=A0A1H9ZAZ0_9FIRM|nr:GntR family transcriptional regulator [[Clostridium] polysaccharolyticum]SES78729.1 DNA-binding transcriptional regulator YhcF, GntR family [[Clostridium] polysaccharolyticum]
MAWTLTTDRPIYLQIIDVIKYRIISGVYKPGDRLPSVRELATEASVNPNTMQKALTELERDNLIATNRTNGKFISEDEAMIQKLKQDIAKDEIQKFLTNMQKLGFSQKETIEILEEISNNE